MTKKATTTTVEKAKLIAITIYCPNLKTNVELTESDYYISSSESECDICGSHGEVTLNVSKCKCNKSHDIEIRSW